MKRSSPASGGGLVAGLVAGTGAGLGALAVVPLLAALFAVLAPQPVAGQGGGRLDLVAQTVFVDGDPAEIVVRVGGDGDPPDLEVEVFDPITDPDELEAAFEALSGRGGRADFRCSQFPDSCTVDASGLLTIRIPDEEVGEFIRRDPGALPVRITLLDDDGDPVQQLTTALVVAPDEPAGRMALGFLATVTAPVALQPGQGLDLEVAAVLDRAEAVAAQPDLPVTVALTPETLDALDVLAPESLEDLLDHLADRPVLRSPWVDIDEEAWRAAGQAERVIDLYTRGIETIEDHTGSGPTGIVRLDPDATPATLGLLRTAGTTAVIATGDQLADDRAGVVPAPFTILDDNGVAMPAVAVDDRIHALLDDDDPELGAYRTLAMLSVQADEAGEHGSLLDIDRVDPVALDLLRQGIESRDELAVIDVEGLFGLEPIRDPSGTAARFDLDPAPAPDLTDLTARLRTAAADLDTFAEMVAPETGPIDPLHTLLLAATASGLSDPAAYPAAVVAAVRAGIDGIEIAQAERITLTDRRADLPLTIVNDQPLPLTVELLLSSEKVRFPDGDSRTLRLDPGDNPIVIPVETLASGDARVTATVTSPGGVFELASGTIDVRSTAISGLGLLISVAALAVLGAWWIRTILRVRRGRAAATVASTPEEHSGPDRGEP